MSGSNAQLNLKTAIGSYGYHAALKDGTIKSPNFVLDHIEVTPIIAAFRRMCRAEEFDICEMAITTYLTARAYGKQFTAIPVFPIRIFPHSGIVVNAHAGIDSPKDLEGKKVGVRAYTVTTGVWARGILASQYGVDLDRINWILGDEEHVAEFHKDAPVNTTYKVGANLGQMLAEGELDAGIGIGNRDAGDAIKPLFKDARAETQRFYQETGIYPINHTIVIKDSLLNQHPWLAPELFAAFKQARDMWLKTASKEDKLQISGGFVDGDPLPIGVLENRKVLETVIQYAHDQKIIPKYGVEDVFDSRTLELS
ncbi:MAG TPA: ABC transporter substrate-binding protein [Dehalococcoidia bacterium]|nr:ABC transporter substrate-binding protein [Dehalococcoidia bacterium]